METIKATVEKDKELYFIKIKVKNGNVSIPISQDNSNEVKNAFNKLIIRLKKGEFKIELEAIGADLFHQVANEYIVQLNREIHEVYGEMKKYGLVQPETDTADDDEEVDEEEEFEVEDEDEI